MLARSTRSMPTRALPALVLSIALAAGLLTACSKDDDASKPAPDGPPASQRAGVPLDVSVGDPVRIADDGPATVTASVAVRGQADTVADLSAIGRALLAYRDDQGTFPPAYLVAADGTPLLSWRVLLLPYLGEEALFRRFDLTKPWDDPANRRLLAEIPKAYVDGDVQRSGTDTAYAGVGGPKTVFPGGARDGRGGISRARVVDGDSMTTAVGPVGSKVAIPWTKPGDVEVPARPHYGDASGFDGPGRHVTPMLFLNGVVRSMPDGTDPSLVHSWSTIAGQSCSPPDANDLQVHASWDLDGDGTYEIAGLTASLAELDAGRHRLAFKVTEEDGTSVVVRSTVTV